MALWLVDPHERIVSTANVPPQQKDWWMEASKAAAEGSQTEIPGSLMTVEEAQEHRVKLMHERSRYEEKAKHSMERQSYNFCEH